MKSLLTRPNKEFLDAAKKYTKRYLSHTKEYKKEKNKPYYHITMLVRHLVEKYADDIRKLE